MGERQKEVFAKRVLNTQRGRTQSEERIDVTVLASDYAKIRSMARKTNHTLRTVLRDIVVAGVRNLAAEAIVLSIVCLALPAHASPGGAAQTEGGAGLSNTGGPMLLSPAWFLDDGSFVRRREEKVAVLSPERLRELQRLIAGRNAFRADIAALERLSAEETEALQAIDARFAGEYGVRQDRQYSYDADKMTLFLVSSDPRHGGTAEQPAFLPHRVFPTEEEAAEFRALMKAKEMSLNALQVYGAALAGRREKYSLTLAAMQSAFGLALDRAYRLEPETRSVFVQFVAPPAPPKPTPEEIAAKKAAEAEAERLAREAARKKALELREEAKRLADEKKRLAAEETEAGRERDEALRRVEKELAEIDAKEAERAKAEAKAKAEAEKKAKAEAERKAKAEAEAKREAEKKAKAEAERKAKAEAEAKREAERKAKAEARAKEEAERKAKAEAEKKLKADKKAYEEARKAAIAAEEERLGIERRTALNAAKKALISASRRKVLAEASLEEAKRDLAWAKSNKKKEELASYKADVAKADKVLDEAEDEVEACRKQVRAAEKAISRISDDAERNIRNAGASAFFGK